MNSLLVEFKTAAQVSGRPLDCFLSSDKVLGDVRLRWFEANLSNVLYASLRDAIVKKLGDRAAENIHRILAI